MQNGAPPPVPAAPVLGPVQIEALSRLFGTWPRLAELDHLVTPISPLALRLIQFDPERQQAAGELVDIVESDPLLTARVLGLANAAAYSGSGKLIFEVKSAVLRLGMNTTTRVALAQLAAVWMRKGTRMPDRAMMRALWYEYLITAFCAHEIAWVLGDSAVSPNVAYAGGLLHDIGTLAFCGAAPELMSLFVRAGYARGTPLHQQFVEAHTGLGEALLSRCGAPATLCEIAARHHAGFSPEESAPAIVVHLADHLHQGVLSRAQGQLTVGDDIPLGCFPESDPALNEIVEALELSVTLDQILENVAADSGRIEALAADIG